MKARLSLLLMTVALVCGGKAWANCVITPSAPATSTGTVSISRTQSGGSCTSYHIIKFTNTNAQTTSTPQYAPYSESDEYSSSPYSWNTATANAGGPVPNENITIQILDYTDNTYTTLVSGMYNTTTTNTLNPVADNAKYLNWEKESVSQDYNHTVCPSTLDGNAQGCSVQVQWAALEPCEANSTDPTNSCYNWPMLDEELNVAEASGYPVDLEILTGGYGAPVRANVCNSISFNSGAPTCTAWLGSGVTEGIKGTNGVTDGGINGCSVTWMPWPGDSTFRTQLSDFEQAFMKQYGGLMGNTIARVELSVISDSGDHLDLPLDGGLCNPNGGTGTTENWLNGAWRTFATGTLGITGGTSSSETTWQSDVETAVENLYSDAFTNMAYSNFGIGLHADDYPELWTSTGSLPTDGTSDSMIHSAVWTSLTGNANSDGSFWITFESMPDNTNLVDNTATYAFPHTTWLVNGEDAMVQSTELTCRSWLVCPESTPTSPNGPIFSMRHKPVSYTTSAINALVPYDTLMMEGTNETGQCMSATCP